MKCLNCGETLKDDAKVCFACGQEIKNDDMDELIDSIIKEDEAAKASTSKKTTESKKKTTEPKKKKFGNAFKKETTKPSSKESLNTKIISDSSEFGKGVQITRYITAGIIIFFLITMLFDWFTLGGRGVFTGFELDENSSQFMTKEAVDMSKAQIESSVPEVAILQYSPKDLLDYVKLYEDDYKTLKGIDGEVKTSWAIVIQTIYIKGFYVVLAIALLSVLFLVFDKKLRTIEWSRGLSVLTMLIMGLNYAALKIPFLSMFALKARSLLRLKNVLSSVTLNMNGINMNNEFYPYNLMEKTGFFIAIGTCVLWFVLTTVLVEMKKDKEYS